MTSADTGIPRARVVAVVAALPGGREQVGSGYLLDGRRVLTAAHCTHDKKTGAAPQKLRVFRASDGASAEVNLVEGVAAAPSLDVAVLRLTEAPWGAGLPAPVFARVDRTRSGALRDCAAIGYPLFQRDPVKRSRSTAELHGTIYQTDEAESGRLLMREPLMIPVGETDPAADAEAAQEKRSPWGGLSGALVFHADRAIGVIVEHYPRQGAAAVRLMAFDTIRKRAATDKAAQHVCDELELPPIEQLDWATAEPMESLDGLVDVIDHTSHDLYRVRDLDPYQLGTTPSDYGNQHSYGDHDPYIPRTHQDVDKRLRAALQPSRLVLVVGPSKVGKSRTAFEAVRASASWQDAHLAAPTEQALAKLAFHPRLRSSSDPLVVWLDDLDRFLRAAEPLTPAVLNSLLARPGHTVVVATLQLEARARLREATGELTRNTRELLETATTIELGSTTEDPDEQSAAQAAYPDESLDGTGLAERLGYAPDLLRAYRESEAADQPLHTVVRAAIDWARTGLARPIPEKDLLDISSDILFEEHPSLDNTPEAIAEAITKARNPPGSDEAAAMLLTVLLPSPSEGRSRIRGYHAYDYLIAADDGQTGHPRPLPERSWQDALTRADNQDAFAVGIAAYQRNNLPISIRGFEQAANAGNTDAMNNLGVVLTQLDPPNLKGARHWWKKAAKAGNADAMYNLGNLLATRRNPPNPAGAYRWWTKAAKAGNADAMYNLGNLLTRLDLPDLKDAQHWYEQAATTGDTSAMYNLGNLLAKLDPPNLRGAHYWWERAAIAGHTSAMYNLGYLLATRRIPPDLDGACYWWKRAANADHTSIMVPLAPVLAVEGDLVTARDLLQRAAQAGRAEANEYAAALDDDPAIQQGAHAALSKRAESGDIHALNFLGVLEWRAGNPDDARAAWTSARDASNPIASILLQMTE